MTTTTALCVVTHEHVQISKLTFTHNVLENNVVPRREYEPRREVSILASVDSCAAPRRASCRKLSCSAAKGRNGFHQQFINSAAHVDLRVSRP